MPRNRREVIEEYDQLVSEKRKRIAERSFPAFISAYLKAHQTVQSAEIHKEMVEMLGRMVSSPQRVELSEYKRIDQKGEGGVRPHTEGRSFYLPPTQIFSKIQERTPIDTLNRLLFLAPRGFAKSYYCSFFFVLWLALYAKKEDIFIVSATISLSESLLRKIRNEIENNELILKDFGDMRSPKWTEGTLILSNGVQITAKGRGFQIRGFRPDMVICDDLEDEDVIYSKDQRDKTEHWFYRTLLPALKPSQGLLYVGTKLHQFALIAKLEKKEEFTKRFYRALVDGKSTWEAQFPTEYLKNLRKEMGTYAFEAEYQNNPISLEDQPVKPHMLDGVSIKGKLDSLVLAVDPAISEKTSSDERAFVLIGRYRDEDGITGFKEVYSETGRWPISEQVERIIDIYKRYEPTRVILEEVAFQRVYRDVLLQAARKQGIFIPISSAELGVGPTKRPKDKFTRLMEVVHLFEQKLVEVQNPKLYEELTSFPHGDSDNMVDAIVYGLYYLIKYGKGGFRGKKELISRAIETKKGAWHMKEVRPGVFAAVSGERPIFEEKKTKVIYLDR